MDCREKSDPGNEHFFREFFRYTAGKNPATGNEPFPGKLAALVASVYT
mgnify:CR=1 FL=1